MIVVDDDAVATADVGIAAAAAARDLIVVYYDGLILFHANQSLVTDNDPVILGMCSSYMYKCHQKQWKNEIKNVIKISLVSNNLIQFFLFGNSFNFLSNQYY